MQNKEFHFVTRWRFQASADAIFTLLNRPLEFTEWWGSFFQRANVLEKGDDRGVDRLIHFKTNSSVPSELIWGYRTLSVTAGKRIDVRISGDFSGDALWLLEEDGIYTDVIFDWNVQPERKLVKEFPRLWRSMIKSYYRRGMEQGRVGLEKELLKQVLVKKEAAVEERRLLIASTAAGAKPTPQLKVKGHAIGL